MIALTAQFLLTNLMTNAVQTPIDFSRGQSREGSLTRGALLWRGGLENPISRRFPAAWCQARQRAARGLGTA